MVRMQRFCPAEVAVHIIQRGNNRQICFAEEDDFITYAGLLNTYSRHYKVAVHAWVFMTSHVHILATPETKDGVSLMMQSIGWRYVRYFNGCYLRTGTLWEGRFKSSLVDTEAYLQKLYVYIEMNPVRAKMVAHSSEYFWPSYASNALGKASTLCRLHPNYNGLGLDEEYRRKAYRALFNAPLDEKMLMEIRGSINKGLAVGTKRFKDEIEFLHDRRVTAAKMGRPKKKND